MDTDFLPFTEKYRPNSLKDVVGHAEIVASLEHFVKTKRMPHLLFSGNPGVGKTTCAIALAKDLFQEDFSSSFLELNASDERGIDVIRGKVKEFAKVSPLSKVPFKIIFLDEADALTQDAQHALRRTMEVFSSVTRFILSCNYSSKIIEPLQSRCTIFRFRQLQPEDITQLIIRISKSEKFEIEPKAVALLVNYSEGDMRKALNILQACAMQTKKIDEKALQKVSGVLSINSINDLLSHILNGKFCEASDLANSIIIENGVTAEELISQLYKQVLAAEISEKKKMEMIDSIGEFHFRITEGANEFIQVRALIARLCLIASSS